MQILADDLESQFPQKSIYQSTGYSQKTENQQDKIKKANIIIATNKAEVGVNYDVQYCIMQPGKYYQNFVQRFGRVARGNLEGHVVVIVNNVKYNSLKRTFKGCDEVNYYDFLDKVYPVIQSKNILFRKSSLLYW